MGEAQQLLVELTGPHEVALGINISAHVAVRKRAILALILQLSLVAGCFVADLLLSDTVEVAV